MSHENFDFHTAGGVTVEEALGIEGILTQGVHYGQFALSRKFIEDIANLSREDGKKPDENNLGRECYSFSERENRAFSFTRGQIESMIAGHGLMEGVKIETDPLGSMYIRVIGKDDSKTHMIGSHLDSVKNGGKYDGVAGIAVGLETLNQVLHYKKQEKLQKSFTLAIFRSEESGPHNGLACLGSAVATGKISRDILESVIYKKENGVDIGLKKYFESSLRAYFQSVEDNDWLHMKDDENYIDHPWWYSFCQEHDISREDYVDGNFWSKIVKSLDTPRITRKNTASYDELHIEQGTIIEGEDVDLGIVSGGIGGAQRYETKKPIGLEIETLGNTGHEIYGFDIGGVSDHTGSTPNNTSLETSEYRKDAFIASARFIQSFLEGGYGSLISTHAQNDEGFTKVPFHQKIELAIDKDKKMEFEEFSINIQKQLEDENAVIFLEGSFSGINGTVEVITNKSAQKIMGSLLGVSRIASEEFNKQRELNPENKQFGTTRVTLTNIHMGIEGCTFGLDVREVDSDDVDILKKGISQALESIIIDGLEGLKEKSSKGHEEINQTSRDTLKKVSDILGYTSIFLPSIPGHDADRVAAVGVPISMVFVCQKDGLSHNPAEKMDMGDYIKAATVMMKSVLAKVV